MKLGPRIRKARDEANLSQHKLGQALGVERQTIANWEKERGKHAPARAMLEKIASVCCVTYGWLIDGDQAINTGSMTQRLNLRSIAASPKWMSDFSIDNCVLTQFEIMDSDDSQKCYLVRGDSMEPEFESGDIIISSSNVEPISQNYVVFRLNDGKSGFKRIIYLDDTKVMFLPINQRYTPLITTWDTVAELEKVVRVLKYL